MGGVCLLSSNLSFQSPSDFTPGQVVPGCSRIWPSAKKHKHTNPAGVIGVRTSPNGHKRKTDHPKHKMNLNLEQLSRRPLGSMSTAVGSIHQVYSHATDPHRTTSDIVAVLHAPVNGLMDMSPSPPPPQQRPTPHDTTPHSAKRGSEIGEELNGVSLSPPPPKKRRPNLSLSRSKSRTPSHSLCSSSGISPCSNSSQPSVSSSTTPPLSPKSRESTPVRAKTLASPLSMTAKFLESTPVRAEVSESPLSMTAKLQEFSPTRADIPVSPAPQPCTSQQVMEIPDTSPIDITPPLEEKDTTLTNDQSDQDDEGLTLAASEVEPNFHDISLWGGGRLVYKCDLPHCRPFDKFSQGHLGNYAEMVGKGGDLENYLHTVERLINQGHFFPTDKLKEVFKVMWKCSNKHAVKKMHFFLQQDISLRTDTRMESSHFWHKLQKCLEALKSNTQVLVASTQLSYLLSFLIKNLDANKLEPRASLVEQLLSSKKTLNVAKILDVIFSLQGRTADCATMSDNVTMSSMGVLSPVECLLIMICLPLLTCDPSSRSELKTKLAREMAMRLDQLNPHSVQYQLITAIPSDYLKEKVIDFVLERNFTLPPEVTMTGQASAYNSVSLAKITSVHLRRLPRHPDGSPHSLSFFLQLLAMLIQSHLMTVTGSQPLVSILPSFPPLPDQFTMSVSGSLPMDAAQLRDALLDMRPAILQLTDRLSQDDQHFIELTEPTTWFHLQLLSLITATI